ncbi:hypothetical protein Aph01nite_07820 [Acrocarpospora phusangensis]|uniref:DUF397 domain-containing protein n=1 Tax=Acrocarpospora phusangensis TaxID=1070424 RepID=A0A919ULQ5_9ACTN|nr:DUF397 domain-containing protein [Acrocarpospora phusangensis]GIH22472.1 hypothetical protein Aph01nite_07820 [Acrocarpospora phusangensis]
MLDSDLSKAVWRKSRRSANGNCIEVAQLNLTHVGIRDSNDRSGVALIVSVEDWRALAAGIKDGEFDF